MKNFMDFVKENKKTILKRALIAGSVVTGLIVGKYLLSKNDEIEENEDCDSTTELEEQNESTNV